MSRRGLVAAALAALVVGLLAVPTDRPAHPGPVSATSPTEPPAGQPHRTLLVRFHPGSSAGERRAALARVGATLGSPVPRTGYVRVLTGRGRLRATLRALRGDASVAAVQPDRARAIAAIPNDPAFASTQGYLRRIRAPQAWDAVAAGPERIVAVLDTGVSSAGELAGRLVAGIDLVGGDEVPGDDNGHGTQVATIIAAPTNDGVGIAGVAPNARIMPVKVLGADGRGYDADIAAGIVWAADHGAHVVNMSFGGPGASPILADAAAYARSRGAVVVASAGNAASPQPQSPAAEEGVIAVSATDADGAFAAYSNFGATIDVAAPGEDIATDCPGAEPCLVTGTSFAAAIVSGVAALAAARWPDERGDQIAERLLGSAQDRGGRGRDPYYGAGWIDALASVGGPRRAPASTDGDASEPNGVPDRAGVVGDVTLANLAPAGDVDWYAVEVDAPGFLSAEVTPPDEDAPLEERILQPEAAVYTPDLRLLRRHRAAGRGESLTVEVPTAAPGRYLVSVRGYGDSRRTSPYTLTLTRGSTARTFVDVPTTTPIPTGASSGMNVVVMDANGDERNDVVAIRGGMVQVLEQGSDGVLRPPTTLLPQPLGYPYQTGIASGDLDGDGREELVVQVDPIEPGLQLDVYSVRDGGLTRSWTGTWNRDGGLLGIADVDGDGRVEILLGYALSGLAAVRPVGGELVLEEVLAQSDPPQFGSLTVGDLDGDGRPDLLLAEYSQLTLRMRAADGSYSRSTADVVGPTTQVGIGDVTGDGRRDVVQVIEGAFAQPRGPSLLVRSLTAAGALSDPVVHPIPFQSTMAIADLDGDGRNDIVLASPDAKPELELSALLQRPDGTLAPRRILGNVAASPTNGLVAVADVTGDGAADVLATTSDGQLVVLPRLSLAWPRPGESVWVRDAEPDDASFDRPVGSEPVLRLARDLDPASLSPFADCIRPEVGGAPIGCAPEYHAASGTLRLHPTSPLLPGTRYVLDVPTLQDTAGARMEDPFRIRFTTAGLPPPTSAPRGRADAAAGDATVILAPKEHPSPFGFDEIGPPVLAAGPGGHAVVAWAAMVDERLAIMAATRSPAGTWRPPVQVSGIGTRTLPSYLREVSIEAAVDGEGRAIVVWSEEEVLAATTADGGDWTRRILSPHGWRPTVALGPDGSGLVAWSSRDTPTWVVARTAAPGLTDWSPEEPVGVGWNPRAAVSASGEQTLFWRGEGEAPVTASRPSGGAWSAPWRLLGAGDPISQPFIAASGDGGLLAAWPRHLSLTREVRQGATEPVTVYEAITRRSDGAWSEPHAVVRPGSGPTSVFGPVGADVGIDATGQGMVVYTEGAGIHVAVSTPGGQWEPTETPPGLPTDGQGVPELAVAPDGSAAIALRVNAFDEGPWRLGILVAFRPPRGPWQEAVRLSGGADQFLGSQVPESPRVAWARSGEAILVWRERVGGALAIRAASLGADPPRVSVTLPETAVAGEPVVASALTRAGGTPLQGPPRWDFGDGTSAVGSTVEHRWARDGRFTVTVSQTDRLGAVSVVRGRITIASPAIPATTPPAPPATDPAGPPAQPATAAAARIAPARLTGLRVRPPIVRLRPVAPGPRVEFRLSRAARVAIEIRRAGGRRARIAAFSVRGRRGANAVPIRARVRAARLAAPARLTVTARVLGTRRSLRATLRVVR